MDTSLLLYAEITYKIRKAIFSVYNELGSGHKENIYHKALLNEFNTSDISFEQEVTLKVKYKKIIVGNYRPDFIIENKIIVEIKAVEYMPKFYEDQLIHYLKNTGFRLGLLVNFGSKPLVIKRLIWTK